MELWVEVRLTVASTKTIILLQVLFEENQYRRPLIDQVVQSAVAETRDIEDISFTVRTSAFPLFSPVFLLLPAKFSSPQVEAFQRTDAAAGKIVLEHSVFFDHMSVKSSVNVWPKLGDLGMLLSHILNVPGSYSKSSLVL